MQCPCGDILALQVDIPSEAVFASDGCRHNSPTCSADSSSCRCGNRRTPDVRQTGSSNTSTSAATCTPLVSLSPIRCYRALGPLSAFRLVFRNTIAILYTWRAATPGKEHVCRRQPIARLAGAYVALRQEKYCAAMQYSGLVRFRQRAESKAGIRCAHFALARQPWERTLLSVSRRPCAAGRSWVLLKQSHQPSVAAARCTSDTQAVTALKRLRTHQVAFPVKACLSLLSMVGLALLCC